MAALGISSQYICRLKTSVVYAIIFLQFNHQCGLHVLPCLYQYSYSRKWPSTYLSKVLYIIHCVDVNKQALSDEI